MLPQVKTASERITRIAEDVSLNTSILQQVGELIKQSIDGGELPDRWENEGDQEQHSMVAGEGAKSTEAKQGVFNTSGLETTMKIATKCKDIFSGLNERLQNASRQLSNGSGKIVRVKLTRVERLKWPFLQPEIDTMRDELKDARGTLTLMFQVAMLAYLGKAMQRQNKCTQTETISEPAEPSSESLTMHIFTPQASIQDNDILINHRHHTINLSPKEVKSQLDAWKSSTPSSICEQLQALTFKERFALDMNKLIGHTTQYPFYKARLEWIHFGEYGPIIHGLETPKARALTVITSSEASPLPSPSRFFPDWNFDKQDRSLPCPPPGKRPTLKVAIDEMNDMPQAHTPESKAASSVVLPPPSPKIEREEEKEEEEDQDDRLSENDWEAEGIVQGLLAAYTT
ncbi:hypothetical protein APSETT445_004811 [Aspergillus pseudonomiae]